MENSDGVTAADLRCMDLLICDTIAFARVDHPKKVHYQLLSGDSLDRIKAEAQAFAKPRKRAAVHRDVKIS
ncbi:MAG: hypothetical protein NVSMB62_12610 [Acidobacteriaceae bacterium]